MKYNFMKLLQDGGPIRKYLTASGGGVTYKSPISDTWNNTQDWRALTNASYEDVYRNMYARPDFNMDEYNNFLGRYYDLMRGSQYKQGDGAVYYQGTNDYLKEFDRRGFHTNEFLNGWEHVNSAYTGDRFSSDYKWGGGDEYVGQTTANRYANSWNDAELARENEIARLAGMMWVPDERALGLETNDGRKFYKLTKTQLSPIVPPPTTPTETPSETPLETPSDGEEEITIPEPIRKLDPWTDWIPLSAQLGNDLMSAERQAALQKQMRFPLIEGPFLQHKITNNYHLRTGMQQNANELRDLGAFRSNSSDLRANMDNMHKYDTQASQIENQAEQIKADTIFKERQISENVENTNKKTGADVANYNTKQNAAAWNNILDAKAKHDLRRTAAINSWIGNMYTSHGEWLKDQRLNDQQYIRGLNQYNATLELQKAYNDYYNLTSDYTKSKAYLDFAEAVKNWSGDEDLPGMSGEDYSNPDKIKALWAGDSDLATQYRERYNKEMSDAEMDYYRKMQMISNRLGATNLLLPARISNQGIYTNPYLTTTYSPLFKHARGGSIRARFIDYQNHIQKEQQKQKELQHKRDQLISKQLNADLDRLSKEQSILLRSVFK